MGCIWSSLLSFHIHHFLQCGTMAVVMSNVFQSKINLISYYKIGMASKQKYRMDYKYVCMCVLMLSTKSITNSRPNIVITVHNSHPRNFSR